MHEYKVVPAPDRPARLRGVKSQADRFALGLAEVLNLHAEDGWELLRTETFTIVEAQGWFGKSVTVTRTMLILARPRIDAAAASAPRAAEPPEAMRRPLAAAAPGPALAPTQSDGQTDGPVELRAFSRSQAAPEAAIGDDAGPEAGPVGAAEPGVIARSTAPSRAEPIFRPGAMLRGEGLRKYPPLRPDDRNDQDR